MTTTRQYMIDHLVLALYEDAELGGPLAPLRHVSEDSLYDAAIEHIDEHLSGEHLEPHTTEERDQAASKYARDEWAAWTAAR